jgi:hypothetical protein
MRSSTAGPARVRGAQGKLAGIRQPDPVPTTISAARYYYLQSPAGICARTLHDTKQCQGSRIGAGITRAKQPLDRYNLILNALYVALTPPRRSR